MGAPSQTRSAILAWLAALGGVSLYLVFAERIFGSLPWVHLLLIPFGNVWFAAVFLALLLIVVARLAHRRRVGSATLGDYGVVILLAVPWIAYIALGTFMHITGGI
jgi:hypothetical protein